MIVIIDYGMGNLHSVRKALEVCGARVKVSSSPADIKKAQKIVFPGVGAFGAAMKELKRRGLEAPIKEAIAAGKPFLGLCLGLQLLFDKSEEAPGVRGLGILRGEVKKFRASYSAQRTSSKDKKPVKEKLKIPHMGWNSIVHSPKSIAHRSKILKDIPDGSYMYFVHSYYVKPKDKKVILTKTGYGLDFASGVHSGNVYALQFHPEKSQELGLRILRNFIGI
jgi:glutamine amidotransferase